MQLLCLHGSRQCGELFAHRLRKLVARLAALNVQCHFPDGPVALPLDDGQSVSQAWWDSDGNGYTETLKQLEALSGKVGGFDGVLGFSQGGCVAALLCALAAADAASPFDTLRFCVTAGALWPDRPGIPAPPAAPAVPSLHFYGTKDDLVVPAKTVALAERFPAGSCRVVEHRHGHIFPHHKEHIAAVCDLVQGQGAATAPPDTAGPPDQAEALPEEVQEELESLGAIYGDDFRITKNRPLTLQIRLAEVELPAGPAEGSSGPELGLVLSAAYPQEVPSLRLYGLARSLGRSKAGVAGIEQQLRAAVLAAAADSVGEPMIFNLVAEATDWLSDPSNLASPDGTTPSQQQGKTDGGEGADAELLGEGGLPFLCGEADDVDATAGDDALILDATKEAAEADPGPGNVDLGRRGPWNYTVGLVGKPSAGKSTLFNALTDPLESESARVAAFPFTTIDPNIGQGRFSRECPSARFQGLTARPEYGFAANGQRKIPLTIKDVAGLVPGAYQGRGKGNAFLNDLCDADVLIHVVDASGLTDSGGVLIPEGGSDPVDDIGWVRLEIHRWIFNNVRAKWPAIMRKPSKLVDMFSGYQSRAPTVHAALARIGLVMKQVEADGVHRWTALTLHRLVAHYLRIRFPMLLALNKADVPSARAHVQRIREQLPHEPVAVVSAKSEWQLCLWRRAGLIEYGDGAGSFEVRPPDNPDAQRQAQLVQQRAEAIRAATFSWLGGTGVLAAVNAAVSLRPPTLVYPVSDLETCRSLAPPGAKAHSTAAAAAAAGGQQLASQPPVLGECLLLRPGSTVEDAYEALKHAPFHLLSGEYVRAEYKGAEGKRVARKQDRVEPDSVLKIMTNKRTNWQTGKEQTH